MNEIMLFLLLCALGALCYGFYSNVWIGSKRSDALCLQVSLS